MAEHEFLKGYENDSINAAYYPDPTWIVDCRCGEYFVAHTRQEGMNALYAHIAENTVPSMEEILNAIKRWNAANPDWNCTVNVTAKEQ